MSAIALLPTPSLGQEIPSLQPPVQENPARRRPVAVCEPAAQGQNPGAGTPAASCPQGFTDRGVIANRRNCEISGRITEGKTTSMEARLRPNGAVVFDRPWKNSLGMEFLPLPAFPDRYLGLERALHFGAELGEVELLEVAQFS